MFRYIGKSKIGIVLAILFGISLFFFRGGSRYSNIFNSDNFVADVSGTKISTTRFNRTLQININQFNQMLGKQMSSEEVKSLQIETLALGALINDALFENEFDKQDFKIDESVIAIETKRRLPGIYEGNKINNENLNEFLRQQQLKIEDIVQIINFDTRNNYFENSLLNTNYPSKFLKKINLYNNQKRKIDYLEISLDKIDLENSQFNNDTIKNFYDENIDNYMTEEERDVRYIIINKNDFLNNFSPTETQIIEYYDNNKSLFYEKEKRSFLQFNFKTNDEAKSFKDLIENLNSFEEIINFSKSNNINYDLFEDLAKDELLEEISTPLFNLNINEKSEIIETNLAKHVLVLKNIEKDRQLKLNEVKNSISDSLKNIETDNYYESLKDKIGLSIVNGNSLDQIYSDFSLNSIKKIENLTQNFDNYENQDKDFYQSLISKVFSSNIDFVSDIIELDENVFYFFDVTEIIQKKPIDFKLIEEIVLSDYKNNKKIEEITKDLNNNKTNNYYLKSLSNKYNEAIKEYELSNNTNDFSQNLISKIFLEDLGVNIIQLDENMIKFINIKSVILPKNENNEKNSYALTNELKSSFGNELMKKVNISTNDSLINAIIDRY